MNSLASNLPVLVTGASSGIGRAIALAANAAGAPVICSGRNRERLAATCAAAAYPCKMFAEPLDLAENLAALKPWLEELRKKHGPLAGLVCAAGIVWNGPLSLYPLARAAEIFAICCHAPLILAGAFCSRRINAGKGSSVVQIAAAAATEPNPGQGIYAAAKGALIAGSKCLAKEAAPHGVRVNCISPGLIEGPMLRQTVQQLGSRFLEKEVQAYPLGLGTPQDVANLAVFLLSGQSAWLTGQNILLSGGR